LRARRAHGQLASGEPIVTSSTYMPWNHDLEWQQMWPEFREHTLVDDMRCYELWQLVPQVAPLDGCLIEVGVWRGGTGALIAHRANRAGISAPVYLCDTFAGVVKVSDRDPYYSGGEHADTSREHVARLLNHLQLPNAVLLEGIFPDETASEIPEEHVRFCHIDVDVYDSASDVLEWVWPLLVPGGLVIFDDYGFPTTPGVTRLVDEQRHVDDRLVLHNLNGHGIITKMPPA
jgi:O-methyltransferase